ncbi:MAG: hybrid sensor histidine kinase/response regulator [Chloroflexi bacterium]|nr:hybrid sensor histidine kinase/response regulator [Chloroflexota bacterium]
MRITVIDDDPDVLDTVLRVLQSEGYEVSTAVNGNRGIRAVHDVIPDLILCDVTMPVIDGYGVFQAVKSDLKTNNIPFVFLTARGSRADQRKGMELGADDYLIKPFSTKELLSCVRTQINKHHSIADRYETTLRLVRKNIMYALPHELRTPLSQVVGYAGLLEMQTDPVDLAAVHQYGKNINRAGQRLQHLIENYLVYAQIEIIASSPDELAKLLNHVIRDTKPVITSTVEECAAKHNRAADVQVEAEAFSLQISENDLRKIIGELVDNAFKFSADGSRVCVKTQRTADAINIIVSDQGRGMSADQVGLLGAYMQFDRAFYEQQGVGLGFMIAKRLIELHGGKLTVESKLDNGTHITIIFPI